MILLLIPWISQNSGRFITQTFGLNNFANPFQSVYFLASSLHIQKVLELLRAGHYRLDQLRKLLRCVLLEPQHFLRLFDRLERLISLSLAQRLLDRLGWLRVIVILWIGSVLLWRIYRGFDVDWGG